MPAGARGKIGVLHTERHRFLVKGLRLPPCEAADPFVQLLQPYYAAKENFIIVAPPFAGKLDALLEIVETLNGTGVVIGDGQCATSGRCEQAAVPEEARRHIAFYNTRPDPSISGKTTAHISVFLDYSQLASLCESGTVLYSHTDADWYKHAVSAAAARHMPPFGPDYTTICVPPKQQSVEFAFATSEDLVAAAIEQLIIPEHTLIYTEGGHTRPVPNCAWVSEISGPVKCKKFIFADIPAPESIVYILDRIESAAFIYKTADFAKLGTIREVLAARGIAVPEHIREIIQNAGE